MLVKICGITNLEDADHAVQAGADMIGLNFWPRSSRYVAADQASKIVESLGGRGVLPVGLFVDARADEIIEIVERTKIEMIQLHGHERPEFISEMPRPVIRAMKFDPNSTNYDAYAAAKYILLDSPDLAQPGGTGKPWDWKQAKEIGKTVPLFLGGGLNPQNVAKAVIEARPIGVDVASGVESEPGKKDPEKVIQFIRAAKSAGEPA